MARNSAVPHVSRGTKDHATLDSLLRAQSPSRVGPVSHPPRGVPPCGGVLPPTAGDDGSVAGRPPQRPLDPQLHKRHADVLFPSASGSASNRGSILRGRYHPGERSCSLANV